MKKMTQKGLVLAAAAILFAGTTFAQPRGGRGMGQGMNNQNFEPRCERVLTDLTDDQKAQLQDLRIKHQKEMLTYRNQMGELRAKQRTIMSDNPIDQKAAEKLIDQKTTLQNQQMKTRLAHRLEIESVLTPEQIDQLQIARMNMGRKGQFNQARGNRQGYGIGQGRGANNQGYGMGQGRGGNRPGPRGACMY